jgi:hypothetical protein
MIFLAYTIHDAFKYMDAGTIHQWVILRMVMRENKTAGTVRETTSKETCSNVQEGSLMVCSVYDAEKT